MVRNPGYNSIVYKVPLNPSDVDHIVFVTKNPEPMIQHLDELIDLGYNMSFQITLTPYGKDLEPNVPEISKVIESMKTISNVLGKDRVIWRYDPIIVNEIYDAQYHIEAFEKLSSHLEGYVDRCIFTFLQMYSKLEKFRDNTLLKEATNSEKIAITKGINYYASNRKIQLSCCTDSNIFTDLGIKKRACIDIDSMKKWGVPCTVSKTPSRKGCKCVSTIDLGMYDTCFHDCIYCYANKSNNKIRNHRVFNSENEILFGEVTEKDIVTNLKQNSSIKITDFGKLYQSR